MLTDTFDIQAKFTRICGAIATQILFESKSPVFKKKNHLFSGGKCDSRDEDERRRCATAIIVKW